MAADSYYNAATKQHEMNQGSLGARNVALVDPSTGTALGVQNGGLPVRDVLPPARDYFLTWLFGSDAALETLTVNVDNDGTITADMTLINPNARQLVIINGNATPDYSYSLLFSRNGLWSTTDDLYIGVTATLGAKSQVQPVLLPASVGYDRFCRLRIKPTGGQAGTQLQFKAYLVGRGG